MQQNLSRLQRRVLEFRNGEVTTCVVQYCIDSRLQRVMFDDPQIDHQVSKQLKDTPLATTSV